MALRITSIFVEKRPISCVTEKNTSQKKSPLSPQVHAADIPQDSRTHMDKKAKIS